MEDIRPGNYFIAGSRIVIQKIIIYPLPATDIYIDYMYDDRQYERLLVHRGDIWSIRPDPYIIEELPELA